MRLRRAAAGPRRSVGSNGGNDLLATEAEPWPDQIVADALTRAERGGVAERRLAVSAINRWSCRQRDHHHEELLIVLEAAARELCRLPGAPVLRIGQRLQYGPHLRFH